MKIFRFFGSFLLAGLLGLPAVSRADDIDLYSISSTSIAPNVLLVMDNGANFSKTATNTCTYSDNSGAPSLGDTTGGIEQCALWNVISTLPAPSSGSAKMNIGLMVYNSTGIKDRWGNNCAGGNGGCLLYPVTPLTATVKSDLLAWIKTWQTDASGKGSFWIKASQTASGAVMQEAWAYYAGRRGLSGRDYSSSDEHPPAGCQSNFVIYVGNAWDNSSSPADGANASVSSALSSAGATSAQQNIIQIAPNSYGASGVSCGTYTMANHNDSSGLYADEWARFMYETPFNTTYSGSQTISTFTIGLLGDQCIPDYPALLNSMASVGGGQYFATRDYTQIQDALLNVLNQIQSDNSAYSAASLPVSVNAQGTYLNQIFLGMFRPDASAKPRWLGNLKQYQFVLQYLDPTKPDPFTATLVLGDATGKAAITNTTGFIDPSAVSFWTYKNTAQAPDSTGGFFINDSKGVGTSFDSEDGQYVDKGGAAQILRKKILTVDYAASPDSPRNLYTYCPSGSSCVAALTDSANQFSTSNSALTSAVLGVSGKSANISLIEYKFFTLQGKQPVALVTTTTPHGFTNGQQVTISGASPSSLNGTFSIYYYTSTQFYYLWSSGTSQTTISLNNATANLSAGFARDTLINWVRGQDNFGDEKSPGGLYTVRPSVHGDIVHSRPVVVNYGDSRGLVVFYGDNQGVFHAVNGSQTQTVNSVPPGGELWGLILPEHLPKLNRQRANTPELKLPTTLSTTAQPKDYFVDGAAGYYQRLNTNGSVNKAYLYLTMRRGGRFIYAVDVTQPASPRVLWRKSYSDVDTAFAELGQTWSRPRVTLVKGYVDSNGKPKPVLVFGAGYDTNEDSQAPAADVMGRGIFVLDAETGTRVWSAAYTAATTTSCSGSSTQAACAVSGMKWAIPSDVTFVDSDNDGLTDRIYVPDLGGNIWRVDLEPAASAPTTTDPTGNTTPDTWRVSQVAALGCNGGPCPSGTTPRKFFYPPSVMLIGQHNGLPAYHSLLLGSGDREHPLYDPTNTKSAYNVTNRFYMIKDVNTGKVVPSGTGVITEAGSATSPVMPALFDATSTTYTDTAALKGFYITLGTGEQTVNAAVTSQGTTFFGTNQPNTPTPNSCKSDLGTARGYALNPFSGVSNAATFAGGGLPPSPIVGIVNIQTPDGRTVQKEFCIGCAGGNSSSNTGSVLPDCNNKSALGACEMKKRVPKNLRRTYWYQK